LKIGKGGKCVGSAKTALNAGIIKLRQSAAKIPAGPLHQSHLQQV
jgi:hypothetical protein